MFIDANTLEDGFRAETDVCIVGAGAAGITLAVALSAAGSDVVLLESGGLVPDAPTQALSDTIDRDPRFPFASTRLRYFGGSTNHWGGLCRALDEDDFLARPWIGESGWPFRRAELVPYYERALPMLEIPRAFSLDDLDRARPDRPYLVARDHPGFTPLVWLQSPPTMMGERYRDAIAEDPHIRCLLHANAVEVSMDAGGRHATGIRMGTLGGRGASVAAKRYVLCAGAIENARLLLLSDSVVPGGIGNGHDLVGRCFMTHFGVGGTLALVAFEDGGTFREEALIQHRPGLSEHVFGWTTNAALRGRLGLLGCSINAWVAGTEPTRPSVPPAIDALLAHGSRARIRTRAHVLAILGEQAPHRESRISLSNELDALGQRRAVVDLRFREDDLRSLRQSVEAFAAVLARRGVGRVRLEHEDVLESRFAPDHHMGTTRMAADPRSGVTDAAGRVHGVDNLYVGGSSLFPTSGFANPTLTIVALALRQADQLRYSMP